MQTGSTFHSHKIEDGLFGLWLIAAVHWSYVCQPTNPIDVYPLTAVPACCIISASNVSRWKNSRCSLKINLFLFMLSAESCFLKKKIIKCIMLLQYVKLWSIKIHSRKIAPCYLRAFIMECFSFFWISKIQVRLVISGVQTQC